MAASSSPGSVDRNGRDEAFDSLDRAFGEAIRPWREAGEPLAVLFSGGVDSGLIAWELRHRRSTSLTTCGTPGAADLEAAEPAARLIGLPWVGSTVSSEALGATFATLRDVLSGLSRSRASILLALAVAIERAPTPELLCGQGADELFLGYAHFRGKTPVEAQRTAASDLERLQSDDWPRSQAIATRLGHRLHAPFLDPRFVRAAQEIPVSWRMPEPIPKALFREWARRRGLPDAIVARPKRALQFGSGVDAWLRRQAGP